MFDLISSQHVRAGTLSAGRVTESYVTTERVAHENPLVEGMMLKTVKKEVTRWLVFAGDIDDEYCVDLAEAGTREELIEELESLRKQLNQDIDKLAAALKNDDERWNG